MPESTSHAYELEPKYSNGTVLGLFAELPDISNIDDPILGTTGLTDQKTYDINPTGSPDGPIDTEPDLEVDTHPDE